MVQVNLFLSSFFTLQISLCRKCPFYCLTLMILPKIDCDSFRSHSRIGRKDRRNFRATSLYTVRTTRINSVHLFNQIVGLTPLKVWRGFRP